MRTTSTTHTAARRLLESGRKNRVFSGAQVALFDDGTTVHLCAGTTDGSDSVPVTDATSFDIASVTKFLLATWILHRVGTGQWKLDAPFPADLPPDAHPSWRRIAMRDLLTHQAGLPAWKPLYKDVPMAQRGTPEGAAHIVASVFRHPVDPTENATYSDLGFIALGHLVSQAEGCSLAHILRGPLAEAIGWTQTGYTANRPDPHRVYAATAHCPWRNRLLRGEVHDDNAWTMGGISGHAGVFSTASDLLRFAVQWLGWLHDGGFVPRDVARAAITRHRGGRGLGVDLRSDTDSTAGRWAGPRTFGHLGFTGTSIWIDPDADKAVVLLTNRIHCCVDPTPIRKFRVAFHDAFFGN